MNIEQLAAYIDADLGGLMTALNNQADTTIDNTLIIRAYAIDRIMADELFSDNYTLGFFKAAFIVNNSPVPLAVVTACRKHGAFEALGEIMNKMMDARAKIAFARAYAKVDGYGHHFNLWDGSCEELCYNGQHFYVFKG